MPTLLIHGGAIDHANAAEIAAWRPSIEHILSTVFATLTNGAPALDAVQQAVRMLEDSGLYNAGKGSTRTRNGLVETDAAIMNGADERAGAVMGMTRLKNSITAARMVMEKTPHVALCGPEAQAQLIAMGCEAVEPSAYFQEFKPPSDSGTVGAVALDAQGHVAAATSTGGIKDKLSGRVGDSPIIGAGCYANADIAVSCTGQGEYFIRAVAGYRLAMWAQARALGVAAEDVLQHVKKLGGHGGLIAINRAGEVAMPFTTAGMIRGVATEKGIQVGILKE